MTVEFLVVFVLFPPLLEFVLFDWVAFKVEFVVLLEELFVELLFYWFLSLVILLGDGGSSNSSLFATSD